MWTQVIVPTVKALVPYYELILYPLTLYIALESLRYPSTDAYSMAGTMTAVTSLAAFVLSWLYTTYLNAQGGGDQELWMCITATLFSAAAVPLAYAHQSKLLGYLAVLGGLVAGGFSGYSYGWCLFIGFNSGREALRVAGSCLMATLGISAFRALGLSNEWINPFIGPISILGTSVYFLALMVVTLERFTFFNKADILYMANIAVYIILGEVNGQPGMANVAKVYGALHAFFMFCRFSPKGPGFIICYTFGGFAGLYWLSLFLNRNPQYIASVFSGALQY